MYLLSYLIFIGIFCTALPTTLLAQPATGISERTGSTITSRTREYFGLFPAISGFESATISSRGDGGIDFIITRGNSGRDTTIALPDTAAAELERYITTYEWLFRSDTNSIRWESLRDIVRPNDPIAGDPAVIVVHTRDGRKVRGAIVFAGERTLLLAPDTLLGDHPRLMRSIEAFGASEIEGIEADQWSMGYLLRDADLRIGGNDTLYRMVISLIVDRRRFYHGVPSPEVDRLIAQKQTTPAPSTPVVTVDEFEAGGSILPFHLFVQTGRKIPMRKSSFTSVYHSVYQERIVQESESMPPAPSYWCVGVEYSVLDWISLGASFTRRGEPRTDTVHAFEEFYGNNWAVFVRGSIVRPKRLFTDIVSRLHVGAGMGVELYQLTIDSRVRPVTLNRYYNRFVRDERLAAGMLILLNCDYHLHRNLSLGIETTVALHPGIPVERQEMRTLDITVDNRMVHERYAYDLYLTSISPTFTLRLHF